MSATLATVRGNVNSKIRNYAGSQNSLPRPVVDETITSVMQTMAVEMDLGLAWATTAVTTTAGTRSYALDNTYEHEKIIIVRCQETGWILAKSTPELIERYRRGTSPVQGEPREYALIEAAPSSVGAQQVTIELGPAPDKAYNYDILRATMPVTLDSDTDEIPFGEAGVRALELLSAAEIISTMSDDVLAEAHLSPRAAEVFRARGERALYWEKVRQGRQKRTGIQATVEIRH